ncbi:MAG: hypothetical protein IJR50_03755 [Treponema sp.]|nr:hypothetical protein [Treponema sp.]
MNTDKVLTAERVAHIKARAIDTSDIPEITREQWRTGHFRNQQRIVILDDDNREWLQPDNDGYQTRLNFALRWAHAHDCPLVDA